MSVVIPDDAQDFLGASTYARAVAGPAVPLHRDRDRLLLLMFNTIDFPTLQSTPDLITDDSKPI